jgi:hypothetical protein
MAIDIEAPGADEAALIAALAALLADTYQAKDADLTAIAALTTTAYGRALLALADEAALATVLSSTLALKAALASPTFTGTPAAPTAAVSTDTTQLATTAFCAAGFQPLDSDLTAIAALSTTAYGRSLLAAADAPAAQKLINVPRGALVTKANDATGQNFSSVTAVTWDQEAYDTDGCHDNVTENTKLLVPSGWSYVRVGYGLLTNLVTGANWMQAEIRKTGSATKFLGAPFSVWSVTTSVTPGITAWSPILQVTGGTDYFELWVACQDSSITLFEDASWFAIELIA